MWIQTATGNKFDLLNPTPDQVHAEDIIAALPLIPCFTGQQQSHRHEFGYSVAQHCLLVSELVEPELALTALLHDAWKIYTADLTKPLNQLLNQISGGKWREVRSNIQCAVAERFSLPFPLPDEVEHADMIARATELRDVMAPPPEPWSMVFPPPAKEVIVPLHPNEVRDMFRDRWVELSPVNSRFANVWVMEGEHGRYILVDDHPAPPVNVKEWFGPFLIPDGGGWGEADTVARQKAKELGLSVEFHSDFMESVLAMSEGL